MGISLGKILKAELKGHGVKLRVWGKASSGLARPDFHDWVAEAPGLMKRHRPDAIIVSLGTNDGQNLRNGKHWFSFGSKRYTRIYQERVDKLLTALAGPGKKRPIVWLGPTPLPDKLGASRMRKVAGLIRGRIAAFNNKGGRATFVDGIAQTTRGGKLIQRVKVPGRKRKYAARAKDNIHLTRAGVRWLLAEPILERIEPCLAKRTAGVGR